MYIWLPHLLKIRNSGDSKKPRYLISNTSLIPSPFGENTFGIITSKKDALNRFELRSVHGRSGRAGSG